MKKLDGKLKDLTHEKSKKLHVNSLESGDSSASDPSSKENYSSGDKLETYLVEFEAHTIESSSGWLLDSGAIQHCSPTSLLKLIRAQ